jgi:hypothetical protein
MLVSLIILKTQKLAYTETGYKEGKSCKLQCKSKLEEILKDVCWVKHFKQARMYLYTNS